MVTRIGPVFRQPDQKRAEPQPQAMKDALAAYQLPKKQELDLADKKAEAATTDEEVDAIYAPLKNYIVSEVRVGGLKGRDMLIQQEADQADAGHAMTTAQNATVWSLQYSYGTHKPMDAWLTDLPADKKVVFNVVCTPSGHAGSNEAECMKNYEKFARENVYDVSVVYEAPDGKKTTLASQVLKVTNPPEYASVSQDFVVDLSQLKGGKLHLMGAARGSAGVEAYAEGRRTVIHL